MRHSLGTVALSSGGITGLSQLIYWLQLVEHELLLFAAFWFIVGTIDELVVDFAWLWLRITGRAGAPQLARGIEQRPLSGRAAVLVAAWREADVIAEMIAHSCKAWSQQGLRIYVGCYRNDPATLAAAIAGAGADARVRLVVHDRQGPTTKADCLNRLYAALCADEARSGIAFRTVVLQDAEDMVHPAALTVIDRALDEAEFIQLPVWPVPQPASPWVAGHYTDEFTEAHTKSMVVRDALGAAIPAAGVGCGFSRAALAAVARERSGHGAAAPFAPDSLTEDYELGLLIGRTGGRSRFLRVRDADGELVATRAFFPASLDESVRQKTRWIHGIALQGWERLGWAGRPIDIWMALRDRRGPLTAIVLAAAYSLLVIEAVLAVASVAGWNETAVVSPLLRFMLEFSFASFVWRAVWRFGFTAWEYGIVEGIRAILRIPVANVIAIMAGRRALKAYVRSLSGAEVSWDKTRHRNHPATSAATASA